MLQRIRTKIYPHKRIVTATAVALACVTLAATILHNSAAASNAIRLATTHQPEPFTELYFNNHRHLPLSAPIATNQTFSFHIANHEAQAVTYNYAVVETVGATVASVRTGSTTLPSGGGTDQVITYQTPAVHGPYSITVELLGRPEVIIFKAQS